MVCLACSEDGCRFSWVSILSVLLLICLQSLHIHSGWACSLSNQSIIILMAIEFPNSFFFKTIREKLFLELISNFINCLFRLLLVPSIVSNINYIIISFQNLCSLIPCPVRPFFNIGISSSCHTSSNCAIVWIDEHRKALTAISYID